MARARARCAPPHIISRVGFASLFAWLGCKTDEHAPGVPLNMPDVTSCEEGAALKCLGDRAVRCLDGGVEQSEDCGAAGLTCDPAYGCVSCAPSRYTCQGNTVYLCSSDGQKESLIEKCSAGTQCSPDGCLDLCARAEKERSYIGCDYWPTFTSNSQLDPVFQPAVVVANPNLVPASVRIEKDGHMAASTTVEPESASTVLLDFDLDLKGTYAGPDGSVLVPGGAYHLVSSVPVTVHQFNPLLYQIEQECQNTMGDPSPGDGQCNSYTNDASLLLPSHVLARGKDEGVSYLGVSRATFIAQFVATGERHSYTGFLSLTAAGERLVKVHVKSSAYTVGSADGKVPALAPGDEFDGELMPGDVLQIRAGTPPDCPGSAAIIREGEPSETAVCDPGAAYDLTGTQIESDGALQVIGGHDCTYVPYDRPACDHLEESLFPLETWGQEVVVTRPRAKSSTLYRLRVISGGDANSIRFDPAIHDTVTLDRGQFLELETAEHLIVRGTKQLAVAQYLEGQGGGSFGGDPSLSLAIPSDQFRESYTFISPDTYDLNYVNVIAPTGSDVLLDGNLIEGFEPIGAGDLQVAPVLLESAGQHALQGVAGQPIGIVLYGYGAYTSYMLPGGLDLRIIGVPL